jgi:hypothetical protein
MSHEQTNRKAKTVFDRCVQRPDEPGAGEDYLSIGTQAGHIDAAGPAAFG